MKKQLLFLTMIFVATILNAQDKPLEEQKFQINAGFNVVEPNNMNNLYLGFDYKIDNELSVGINFSRNLDYSYSLFGLSKISNFGGELQTNFDWAKKLGMNTNKWDVYTGFNIGIVSQKNFYNYYSQNYRYNDLRLGGQIGVRYFVTKNWGVNVELNSGNIFNTPIRGGITYKFLNQN
jgi:hypothetical protein